MSKSTGLVIKNLTATLDQKTIVDRISLSIKPKELHVIMGPNGSGKSTLTLALMGSPTYEMKATEFSVEGKDLREMSPEERAKAGFMLAFQNPLAIAGVTLSNLLRTAHKSMYGGKQSVLDFHKELLSYADTLKLPHDFLKRSLNDGFSGGEKKKAEMLQLLALKPKFVALDEIDTGLDVDALKVVAQAIQLLQDQGTGVLLITHYQRIVSYLHPDFVHIFKNGKLIQTGTGELITRIEKEGYAKI